MAQEKFTPGEVRQALSTLGRRLALVHDGPRNARVHLTLNQFVWGVRVLVVIIVIALLALLAAKATLMAFIVGGLGAGTLVYVGLKIVPNLPRGFVATGELVDEHHDSFEQPLAFGGAGADEDQLRAEFVAWCTAQLGDDVTFTADEDGDYAVTREGNQIATAYITVAPYTAQQHHHA